MGLKLRIVSVSIVGGLLAASAAQGDEVILKNGGRLTGRVVERTAARLTIETGPGTIVLAMSRVDRIVEGRSALGVFTERAAELSPDDVGGWADLARYAEERDLPTQARQAWNRVLAREPGNPEANAGVGRVQVSGAWMSSDEAYRSRGYVFYEGRWVTPSEHDALVRERLADEAAARDARESRVRVREAEARAEEAETRAREAREASEAASSGIPYDYVWGSGPFYGGYAAYDGYGGYGAGYGGGYRRGISRGGNSGHGSGGYGGRYVRPVPAPHPQPPPPPRPAASQSRPPRKMQAAIAPPPPPSPRRR